MYCIKCVPFASLTIGIFETICDTAKLEKAKKFDNSRYKN